MGAWYTLLAVKHYTCNVHRGPDIVHCAELKKPSGGSVYHTAPLLAVNKAVECWLVFEKIA